MLVSATRLSSVAGSGWFIFILSRNSVRNNIVRITMDEYTVSDNYSFFFSCSYCLDLFKNCIILTV